MARYNQLRQFARNNPGSKLNLLEKMNKNIPERESVKVGNEYAQETIMDPLDEEVTKEFISHMYLKPQSLPQP